MLVPLLLTALLGALVSPVSAARPADEAGPPSLVLVTLDTTRADRIGAYGSEQAHTPSLDALAQKGALFERAYAVSPVTLPSHASLLTGLYPPRHGVRDNGSHALDPGHQTMAERLHAEGYRTAAFVSASVLDRRYGLDQGFDVYDDDLSSGPPKEPRMVAERRAAATVDHALTWADALSDERPFFLWVHLFDPHVRYDPPPPWDRRFENRPYEGEIAYMDSELGRLLAHPRLAPSSDVLVVAIGDHGESLGEHGEASHGMLVYDATLHVPWIVAGAGVDAGSRQRRPVTQVDVPPTLLALLGLEEAATAIALDGRSVAASLVEPTASGGAAPDLYAESLVPFYTYGWAALRSLRRDTWKYIEAPQPELYDLASDPGEMHNLFVERPQLGRELGASLRRRFGSWVPSAARPLPRDSAAEAKLRSLGYLSGTSPSTARSSRPDPKRMMDVHRRIEQAEALLYAREFEAVLSVLRPVLRSDPENLAALRDTALALGELGRLAGAENALRRGLELAPRDPDLHLSLGQILGARGRLDEAVSELELALELAPGDPHVVAALSALLDRAGRQSEAADLLRENLEEGADPLLQTRYAELVDMPAGRLDMAESRLREATARQPHLTVAWKALGSLLERQGRLAAARQAYEEGLGFQPKDASLLASLGLLLAESGDPEAEEPLRQAVRLSPAPDLEVLNALAELAERTGSREEAASLRQRVLQRPATSLAQRHQRARALVGLGRREEAAAEWRDIVTADPGHAASWQALAALAVSERSWEEAETASRQAVEADPTLPDAWNTLGIAREETEGLRAALPFYRRALAEEPGYWRAAFNLGLALRRLGRFEEAAEAFRSVLDQEPAHAKSHYELGVLFAGPLRDPERARQHFETSLRLEGDPQRAQEIRRLLDRLPTAE